MKRFAFSLLSILLMISLLPVMVNAEKSIEIFVNGEKIESQHSPLIADQTVLMPLDAIRTGFGAQADWSQTSGSIAIRRSQVSMEMSVGRKEASVSGQSFEMDEAPRAVNGTVYVPARFTGGKLGAKVTWDALNRSLYIFVNDRKVQIESVNESPASQAGKESAASDGGDAGSGSGNKDGQAILSGNRKETPSSFSITQISRPEKPFVVQSIQSVGDQIVLQADAPLSSNVFGLSDPNRIVMDLPYGRFAEQLNGQKAGTSGEIPTNHPLISKIRYAVFSVIPSTIRIVIDLKQPAEYKVVADDTRHRLILSLRTHMYKVVVDAGHGGRDPGSTGVGGTDEKQFTLSLAQKVNQYLEAEPLLEPFMTRTDDSTVSLDDRVDFANRMQADLFVSVHANIYETNSAIRGGETYYSRSDSLPLAQILHRSVLAATGFPDRGVRQEDYRVIKNTTMPAALLEVGYFSNPSDEAQMLKADVQDRIARSIVEGIKEYLHLK
ncbi:N-acetylmuramoyl-L-alanine amidase [Ferviditalea candida]|uniref:N-acetylmuramoyl-L-alanine amidase family protein n=1 Tax=Ferviditalea candida TaxID=3108399 RepID=A0ABU5ZFR1_9BACL|nr:N-acetylmuramoyl-L-alanine amidase family protein [Paenibacillaceae bacterium T2]